MSLLFRCEINEQMHMTEFVFTLVLLIQACGPLLAQTPTPEPDPPGMLQSFTEKAREAKTKVQDFGGAVLSFLGTYYEDRIEPVTSSYAEWASKVKNSVWEKIQAAISD